MAQQFAIGSLDEAKAYLQHPILGPRLRACTQLVLDVNSRSAEEIFGYPDYLKFRSCMTLFLTAATDNTIFKDAPTHFTHDRFYCNRRYAATTSLAAGFERPAGGLAPRDLDVLFQVRLDLSGLHTPISPGVLSVSLRTIMNNAGYASTSAASPTN